MDVQAVRQVMEMAITADGDAEPVAASTDLTLDTPGGALPARAYRGAPGDDPRPVLVWLHGGGFVMGDLECADGLCRRLANRCASVVLSIDYRLAPEHPAPAAVEDAWHALLWAAEHAATIGGDPTRLAVGGDSAGGNLAALVTLRARDAGGPSLGHQMLVYPATDLARSSPSHQENAAGMFDPAAVTWFYEQYLAGADPHDPAISPHAASDLSGLPPTFLLTAGRDPLRDEGHSYATRLTDAGVDVEHRHYERMVHGFFQMAGITPVAVEAADAAASHLRAIFGLAPPPTAEPAPVPAV